MVCRRVRPTILKVRNQEALWILTDYTGEEISEWVNVEEMKEIDVEALDEKEKDGSVGIPVVVNLPEWLSSPWNKDE